MTDLYMIVCYWADFPARFAKSYKQIDAQLVSSRLNWVTLGEL